MPGRIVTEIERRYSRHGDEVLARLRGVAGARGRIDPDDVDRVAAELRLPRAHVYGAASFYADLAFDAARAPHVQVCAGTACFAASGGARLGRSRSGSAPPLAASRDDGEVSLQPVYCLGYCYGGPAALDGERPAPGRTSPTSSAAQRRPATPRSRPGRWSTTRRAGRCRGRRPGGVGGLAAGGADSRPRPREPRGRGVRPARPRRRRLPGLASGARPRGARGRAALPVCNGDEGDPGLVR